MTTAGSSLTTASPRLATASSSVPQRKSAQRASNIFRKYAVFRGSGRGESDKEGDVYEVKTSDSSSEEDEDEAVEIEGDVSSEPAASGGEISGHDHWKRHPNKSNRHYPAFDTEKMYADIIASENAVYNGMLSHIAGCALKEVHFDEHVDISVQNQSLGSCSSIEAEGTSIGYAGGTVTSARWIPNSGLLCLAVSNLSHIVSYSNPSTDTVQLWSFHSKQLKFLYSVKLTLIYDIIVNPYHDKSQQTVLLCVACKNFVQLLVIPTARPSASPHYELTSPSLQLNIGPNTDTNISVTTICWSRSEHGVSVMGGLSNGYVLKWTLPKSLTNSSIVLPDQKVLAHAGHPVVGISVCPQRPHYFASVAHESRVKVWNLKNLSRCMFMQTRPQKQLLAPTYIHWCAFWSKVLIHSAVAKANHHIAAMSLDPVLDPTKSVVPSMHCPSIFPPELSALRSRTMDFNDLNSSVAVGFHHGLTAMYPVMGLWDQRYLKFKHPLHSSNISYVQCLAKVKSGFDVSKEFQDDQDYINHFDFTLSTKLSDTFSSDSDVEAEEFIRKSLTAVTHVEWNRVPENYHVCICYMSGLFQIVTPPKPNFKIRK